MWFKNALVFSYPDSIDLSAARLEPLLAARPLMPCNQMSMSSIGWLPASPGGPYVYALESHCLVTLGYERRLLPSSVIKARAQELAEELEEKQGFPPGRKQLRDLKERALEELMPKSFTTRSCIRAWIDTRNRRVYIDTSSSTRAEDLITALRTALESFAATPLNTRQSAQDAMTVWLQSQQTPPAFNVENQSELRSADKETRIGYTQYDLDRNDVLDHVKQGMVASKLGLTWSDRVSFVLTDKMLLKRIRPTDIEDQEESGQGMDEAADPLAAPFTLMTGTLTAMTDDLIEALGGLAET